MIQAEVSGTAPRRSQPAFTCMTPKHTTAVLLGLNQLKCDRLPVLSGSMMGVTFQSMQPKIGAA